MLVNVGHTIQKMIHNTPAGVSANATTTTVVTSGGSVFQAGLIGNKIQDTFKEVLSNSDIVGHVVDAKSTDSSVFFLNAAGSVFEYNYTQGNPSCNPRVREVYSPCVCNGDPAVKIATGSGHAVILTAGKKVFGVGSNEQYQIVPQGQCEYDIAQEIIITDTNAHDNNCACSFTGVLNELTTPVLPAANPCGNVSCVSGSQTGVQVGTLDVALSGLAVNNGPTFGSGILSIPVLADYTFSGFLCADSHNQTSGSVTVNVSSAYVASGCYTGNYSASGSVNLMVTDDMSVILAASTQTSQISGTCGSSVQVALTLNLAVVTATADTNGNFVLSSTAPNSATPTVAVQNASVTLSSSPQTATLNITGVSVPLNCCPAKKDCCSEKCALPQPCWADVFAGSDVTVLADSCNRLYVLGSLHQVRNNHDLLKRTCLDKLLGGTSATITMPADQLHCATKPRNDDCKCVECQRKCKTDLSKFGIQINFPGDCGGNCGDCSTCCNPTSLCDFLKNLQNCNDAPQCSNTCEPCDPYVYLDVKGSGTPACKSDSRDVRSITLHNRKSVAKTVSTGSADRVCVSVSKESVVEFDLNKYCVDGHDYCLDKTIKLEFGGCGDDVNLYIDLDTPGGLKFKPKCDNPKNNVEFQTNLDTDTHKFLLNYGSVLDPVEVANLRGALSLASTFPSPCYLNPFNNKITNTYLRGGDSVQFISSCHGTRLAVTADVPTVFRLNRRILDVGVGDNNLSVLVGGLACPNEIYVIGNNCHGELGINSNESPVSWKQVNRCLFDCQVNAIFSGCHVTFYVTQSGRVYASGTWKCLVHSNAPVCVPSICESWKTKKIAVGKTHIVLLTAGGCLFGVGDNSLGELGLCHIECVPKFKPIGFFQRLNRSVSRELHGSHDHPVVRKHKKAGSCPCGGSDPDDCTCEVSEVRYVRYNRQVKTQAYIPNGRVAYRGRGY